jgi:catechol 2,3-dioxygenase-like lactoylglutathione lyase family enzyme
MGVPQRVNIVTLGARDLSELRAFYRSWGWTEHEASNDGWVAFDVGGWLLALWPIDQLATEASAVPVDGWNGVTWAINVATDGELQAIYAAAVEAGARPISPPTEREWGGASAYVADPEGNRWELARSNVA